MEIANPMWLWALAGLLIPIGIHFLSRKEGGIIEIGSIRFLRESPAAKLRRVNLNEIALLLLRCLLVLILVLLLAGLQINWLDSKQKWLVLEEGIPESERLKNVVEKFRRQGYDIRTLASGFPSHSNASAHNSFENYWLALKELSSQPIDSAVVISFGYQHKFKGPRLPIPPHIRWIPANVNEKEFIAEKIRTTNDSVWIRRGHTSSALTHFETFHALGHPADSSHLKQPRNLHIAIVKGDGFDLDEHILHASLEAIKTITPHQITTKRLEVKEGSTSSADFIFWLAHDPPAQPAGSVTIAFLNCPGKNLPLLLPSYEAAQSCPSAGKETWVITQRLNIDVALKQNFTLQLAQLILPPVSSGEDLRTVPEVFLWQQTGTDHTERPAIDVMKSADNILMILLLSTLATERIIAFRRKQ